MCVHTAGSGFIAPKGPRSVWALGVVFSSWIDLPTISNIVFNYLVPKSKLTAGRGTLQSDLSQPLLRLFSQCLVSVGMKNTAGGDGVREMVVVKMVVMKLQLRSLQEGARGTKFCCCQSDSAKSPSAAP